MKRSEALAMGLSQFTTGEPCKRGHNTYRYTQSGSCSMCVAEHRTASDLAAPRRSRLEGPLSSVPAAVLADYKARAVSVRLRSYEELSAQLFDVVEAYNIARWPEIPSDALRPASRGTSRAAGTALYEVRCHPDDFAALLEESNKLLRKGSTAPVRPDWVRINSEFDAEEQKNDGWPTHDPR